MGVGRGRGFAMKIFSFNIRGLGAVEKRREIWRLISERRPDVFCIQETTLEVVDDVLICVILCGGLEMRLIPLTRQLERHGVLL